MIDPKELRIGNIINYKPSVLNDIVLQGAVRLIHGDSVYVDGKDTSIWFEDAHPIHITQAWLERLGFEDEGSVFRLRLPVEVFEVHNHFSFYLHFSEDYSSTELSTACSFGAYGYMNIGHVHQLQNLYFALTGSELTITEKETT